MAKATRPKPAAKKNKPADTLSRLRSICLAFPGAHEAEAWEAATFRFRNKLFAMYSDDNSHHEELRPGVWIKSTLVNQDLLLRQDPERYFRPPYVGPSGWIGVWLDKRPNWKEVAALLRDGYDLIAAKRKASKPRR